MGYVHQRLLRPFRIRKESEISVNFQLRPVSRDPVHVGSLGVNGIVVQTEYLSDLIEEFWLLTFCRVRHIRLP
jgi:hypothetical protein